MISSWQGHKLSAGSILASSAIVLPADVWAFGASSMAGGQIATSPNGGTEDSLTDVVRAIENLTAGSLGYTTVGVSQTNRPIDYNLTGVNIARKIKNRAVGGQTSGSAGTIVSTMTAAASGFGASDFIILHQGDNGISAGTANAVELLADGYAAMRTQAGARSIVHIVNTQGGRGSAGAAPGEAPGSYFAYLKAASYQVQNTLNPGKVASFHLTLLENSTAADANDTADLDNGYAPRSYMMDDGSHQKGKGYNLQSAAWVTPLIDAVAGGTPFPLRQIVEAQTPATPAAGDAIGNIVAYGSGGSFALDNSNTQTAYAVAANGAITRIGATPPTRDITWAAVKTSKSGRFDKVQPRIGIAERAASGVSKLVEFDGKCIIGMPDSKLVNGSKLTILFRVQATDLSVAARLFGGGSFMQGQITTTGNFDFFIRNAAATTVSVMSKTTANARFAVGAPARWVAICIDLSNPAAEITKLVTWTDPSATVGGTALGNVSVDTAVLGGANQPGADTTTVLQMPLSTVFAIGALTAANGAGATFGKFRMGDFTLWTDYIDFEVLARRQEVANADGTPKTAWVSGNGVTDAKTPAIRFAGNAADWRSCRITGSLAPATPGASGQYFGFNNQRLADLEWGYLSTVP